MKIDPRAAMPITPIMLKRRAQLDFMRDWNQSEVKQLIKNARR